MTKKSHTQASRRDRRKAKQSEFAREGTVNPRKKGHHLYEPQTGGEGGGEKLAPALDPCHESGGHEFVHRPELGVKVCRWCQAHGKMAEREFVRQGMRIQIPEEVRARFAPPPAPPLKTKQKPEPKSCKPGEHEYRVEGDLGVRICKRCKAVTKA